MQHFWSALSSENLHFKQELWHLCWQQEKDGHLLFLVLKSSNGLQMEKISKAGVTLLLLQPGQIWPTQNRAGCESHKSAFLVVAEY